MEAKRKLYAMYTVNNFMDIIYHPFAKPFEDANPDIRIYKLWMTAYWQTH